MAAVEGRPLPPVRSDDLFDVLVAIVNTAQTCPDRCMVDVCNDNFLVHGVNLRARLVPGNEDSPVRIMNCKLERIMNRLLAQVEILITRETRHLSAAEARDVIDYICEELGHYKEGL